MKSINLRVIALIGFFIYLCGLHIGNVERVLSFFVFFFLSIWSIRLKKQKINYLLIFEFIFFLFLCLSYLWANTMLMNTFFATTEILTTFAISYVLLFVFSFINSIDDVFLLIKTIIFSLLFLLVYLVINTPLNVWGTMELGINIGMDKNGIGMYFALGSALLLFLIRNKSRKNVLYLILLLSFIFIVLISGSRKAVLILVFSVIACLLFTAEKRRVIPTIFVVASITFLFYYLIMNNSVLYDQVGERMGNLFTALFSDGDTLGESDKSIVERSFYRSYAIQMFKDNTFTVFFGNGLDGFRTKMLEIGYSHVAYSHCNFTELLANYGLFGFVLYYLPKVIFVIVGLKTKKKSKMYLFFIILVVLQVLIEYGLVSYYDDFYQIIYAISTVSIVKLKFIDKNLVYENEKLFLRNDSEGDRCFIK